LHTERQAPFGQHLLDFVAAMLTRADEALYEAKRNGRDRVEGAPATVQRRT